MNPIGKYSRIDLSNRTVSTHPIDAQYAKKYFLGSGYAAYLFLQELDADLDPLDPASPIYIFNGIVTGTSIPTACRTSFCGCSPLTGIWNESNMGGHFGAALSKAGLAGLVIIGRADNPVYLYINDGDVEIRAADHLWGMDTFDAYDHMLAETNPKARAAVIGPAGERHVRFAAIMQGGRTHNRTAGRGGMGALLGSKHVKGIVVYGSDRVKSQQRDQLRELIREQNPIIRKKGVGLSKFGTAGGVVGTESKGDLPIQNFNEGSWPAGAAAISGQKLAETYAVKQTFCHACPIGCGKYVDAQLEDGIHIEGEGPEYETLAGMGAMLEIDDIDTMLKANDFCNRMGMDTISASATAAFAVEAFENGLITKDQCEGHTLQWEDGDTLMLLLEWMAERRGIGEILSLGTRAAAQSIGKDAEKYAMHAKGMEVAYHDPRATFSMAANYATANRGGCHLEGLSYWQLYGLDGTSWAPDKADRFSNQGAAREAIDYQNYFSIYNPLGICKFLGKGGISPQVIVDLVNAHTGWDISPGELLETGDRIFNLKRIINNRLGVTRSDDDLPERLKTQPRPDGDAAGQVPDLDRILEDYYHLRGWREDGCVSEETIRRLGLEELV